jgi:hypothetical protein
VASRKASALPGDSAYSTATNTGPSSTVPWTSGSGNGSAIRSSAAAEAGSAKGQVTIAETARPAPTTPNAVETLVAWAIPPRNSAPMPFAPWNATR